MTAFFSKSCEYGIQAVLYIARENSRRPLHLQDIASALRISPTFLSKILQKLARAKIVKSQKGNQGGFTLVKPARQILLGEIVEAVDGIEFLSRCVTGFAECSDNHACSLHSDWVAVRQIILRMLNEKNIGDLSEGIDVKIDLLNPGYIQRRLLSPA